MTNGRADELRRLALQASSAEAPAAYAVAGA